MIALSVPDYEFSLLNEIGAVLSSSLNLRDTLKRIYKLLHEVMGIDHGVLTLIEPSTNELHVEMAYGLTKEEIKRKQERLKNGIEEEVISTQKPTMLYDLNENMFVKTMLPKTYPDYVGYSYILVPISLGTKKLGSLSAAFPKRDQDSFNRNYTLLSFVALMVGQEVELKRMLDQEKEALQKENTLLKDELREKYNIHNMIGTSSAMQLVYENIIQVASSNATVLIRGESGTGKELVAHAIHYNSSRAKGPFIKINCSAIPETLIESELFGYEKGAFTDAHDVKIGKIESAHEGTLFLDEIGELALAVQVKLLRVLQEREFERVGGVAPIKVNVRIVAATNKDLELEVQEKRFRSDLYYRLNVFPLFIPPLRERTSDILLLAEHFLKKFSRENNKSIHRVSSLAVDILTQYHWPGNVRELENCMERAVLVCQSHTIQANHLPPSLQRVEPNKEPKVDMSLEDAVRNVEKEWIINALKTTRGHQIKAAELLKTTPRILGYKMKQLAINLEAFKINSKRVL